jgi:hypothetical protein
MHKEFELAKYYGEAIIHKVLRVRKNFKGAGAIAELFF